RELGSTANDADSRQASNAGVATVSTPALSGFPSGAQLGLTLAGDHAGEHHRDQGRATCTARSPRSAASALGWRLRNEGVEVPERDDLGVADARPILETYAVAGRGCKSRNPRGGSGGSDGPHQ